MHETVVKIKCEMIIFREKGPRFVKVIIFCYENIISKGLVRKHYQFVTKRNFLSETFMITFTMMS